MTEFFDGGKMVDELIYLLRIVFAVVLGFAIGFERKLRFKEAGIRTHTIVSGGSALIMIVSKYAFSDTVEFDSSRVAAQIVSGIGFLGAGIIIYRKQVVHGLTTAAGVWATSGVGMAAGGGLYIVAAGATVILIAIQCILHLRCKLFSTKKYVRLKIVFEDPLSQNANKVTELFGVDRFNKLHVERKGDKIFCIGTVTTDKELPASKLSNVLNENDYIHEIERCDNE